ncbi:MAG TPA: hypothetical protein VHT96_05545 [Clostridia bacterium]|nr:hypothetical protein [Clostridia bacterium]
MVKLKSTFYLYTDGIGEQVRKSITNKYIEQISKGVLNDIVKNSEQAGFDNLTDSEAEETKWNGGLVYE